MLTQVKCTDIWWGKGEFHSESTLQSWRPIWVWAATLPDARPYNFNKEKQCYKHVHVLSGYKTSLNQGKQRWCQDKVHLSFADTAEQGSCKKRWAALRWSPSPLRKKQGLSQHYDLSLICCKLPGLGGWPLTWEEGWRWCRLPLKILYLTNWRLDVQYFLQLKKNKTVVIVFGANVESLKVRTRNLSRYMSHFRRYFSDLSCILCGILSYAATLPNSVTQSWIGGSPSLFQFRRIICHPIITAVCVQQFNGCGIALQTMLYGLLIYMI